MRSNFYCDEVGYNCFDPAEVVSPSTCPTGEFVTGFRPNGELKCATPSGSSSNCVIEQRTVSACVYDSSSVPPCPSGWNQISLNQGGRCSTNNVTWSRLCIRNVCS